MISPVTSEVLERHRYYFGPLLKNPGSAVSREAMAIVDLFAHADSLAAQLEAAKEFAYEMGKREGYAEAKERLEAAQNWNHERVHMLEDKLEAAQEVIEAAREQMRRLRRRPVAWSQLDWVVPEDSPVRRLRDALDRWDARG